MASDPGTEPAAAGTSSAAASRSPGRLAGAPISWGVCEVPGWGRMLPPERVLGEMASLGLTATELGPVGYLPFDAAGIRAALEPHGLRLVGGFVPLVLHEPDFDRAATDEIAAILAAAGADVLVLAVVADEQWSAPAPLDDAAHRRLVENIAEVERIAGRHGLTLALHPHQGTLVETAQDVQRMLAASRVGWCFDSGHLLIGGTDPVEFVARHGDRIVHVHLKDVDAALAERTRNRELSLMEATQAGLFRPLGRGDAGIGEIVALLDQHGYERWLVLEQDTAITGQEPPVGSGPVLDVAASIEYLQTPAPARGERLLRS